MSAWNVCTSHLCSVCPPSLITHSCPVLDPEILESPGWHPRPPDLWIAPPSTSHHLFSISFNTHMRAHTHAHSYPELAASSDLLSFLGCSSPASSAAGAQQVRVFLVGDVGELWPFPLALFVSLLQLQPPSRPPNKRHQRTAGELVRAQFETCECRALQRAYYLVLNHRPSTQARSWCTTGELNSSCVYTVRRNVVACSDRESRNIAQSHTVLRMEPRHTPVVMWAHYDPTQVSPRAHGAPSGSTGAAPAQPQDPAGASLTPGVCCLRLG